MHPTLTLLFSLLAASLSALVLPRQAQSIASLAGGGPPNSGPPLKISPSAIAAFSGVNFLENMEAAFFRQGLQNLTAEWNTHRQHSHAISVIERVHAQELVHAQTAEAILKANNAPTFRPCKYAFPVRTAGEFFALANVITTVGIGAVIDLASSLALTDPTIVQGPTSILATEARHDAFFRSQRLAIPNPSPFDTRISSIYALNLASAFIIPGTCASMPSFPVIPPLQALTKCKTTGSSGLITFTLDTTAMPHKGDLDKQLYIGWVNQANKVAYQPATIDAKREGVVTSTIPAGMAGMAFAALTGQNEVEDVDGLTEVTIAGPAPVQIS